VYNQTLTFIWYIQMPPPDASFILIQPKVEWKNMFEPDLWYRPNQSLSTQLDPRSTTPLEEEDSAESAGTLKLLRDDVSGVDEDCPVGVDLAPASESSEDQEAVFVEGEVELLMDWVAM
jgi:hypothetical protein